MLLLRLAFRWLTPVHVWLFRVSRGRIGGRGAGGLPVLLLTTTGRRSGKTRTTPLCYVPDGRDLIVLGSSGGYPQHPAWALNVRDTPEARIEVGGHSLQVRAGWVEGTERDRLWQEVTERYPFYLTYARRAGRIIPIVRLTPID